MPEVHLGIRTVGLAAEASRIQPQEDMGAAYQGVRKEMIGEDRNWVFEKLPREVGHRHRGLVYDWGPEVVLHRDWACVRVAVPTFVQESCPTVQQLGFVQVYDLRKRSSHPRRYLHFWIRGCGGP